ncbi:flagellar motor switch/type III secretory pathway protein FliN [Sphingomonas sp. BE138]|uniref:FliM/FliN family flagellar motor switch protein n=1 Tax=Sphingomonas sp. BE138 TaxID=2817845 RepID=UPI00285BD7AF|nr:FliM/FliN family flagellar motor switch protein [Sphingomonas sp. BE138]MDR6787187.1 flagellar motor switch/type III secretory pathway protein FliN [Sphingomonas sp. BE138]
MSGALAQRLRRITPAQAGTQLRLVGAFNRRRIGAWRTEAGAANAGECESAAGWLRFAAPGGEVAVAPLIVDGAALSPTAMQDAISAAALLDPIEPLVAALEAVVGAALRPVGLAAAAGEECFVLRVDALTGDVAMLRLLIAVPPDLPLVTDPANAPPLDPDALAAVPVAWRATIIGPALSATRAAALTTGDLVLLGTAPFGATLWCGARERAAHLHPGQGRIIVQEDATAPIDATQADHTAETIPADVPVRLAFAIDGGTMPAGDMATLGAGSVLHLPATGETLPVRILSGGATIGAGELVAIGDGFGVIVTARTGDR